MAERVAVITVQYGDGRHTDAMGRSLHRLPGFERCRLIVANNGAPDERSGATGQAVLDDLDRLMGANLTVVPTGGNLYYWRGAIHALQSTYPDPSKYPDWVVICNNDIVFAGDDFLVNLLRYEGARFHVIAPYILSEDSGREQNPFLERPLSRLQWFKWRVYFTHYYVARALLLVYLARRWFDRRRSASRGAASPVVSPPRRIYAPHGAFMIFSRQFFQRGGTVDTGFIMYGEELSVAETARHLDLGVYYCPDLRVRHCEHGFMGVNLTRRKYTLEREAYRYIRGKYF